MNKKKIRPLKGSSVSDPDLGTRSAILSQSMYRENEENVNKSTPKVIKTTSLLSGKCCKTVTQIHGRNRLAFHIIHRNLNRCILYKIKKTCCLVLVFIMTSHFKHRNSALFTGELHSHLCQNHSNVSDILLEK